MEVERDRAQRHGPAQVEQHLDDAVDPVDLLRSTSVYSPHRASSPSSRFRSCTAPRMAPRGFRISWASPIAICPAAASVSPRRISASSWCRRVMSRMTATAAVHRAALPRERRRDDAHVHPSPVGGLDQRLGLRAALARRQRIAQVADERRVGGEHLLEGAAEDAARRPTEQRLRRRVPEDEAQPLVDADNGVGQVPPGAPRSRTASARAPSLNRAPGRAPAFMVSGARSPASSRSWPAAAIIAALSVQRRREGTCERSRARRTRREGLAKRGVRGHTTGEHDAVDAEIRAPLSRSFARAS